MTIVTTHYRYKRPPRKRKPNPAALAMPRIVTAKKPKSGIVPTRVAKAAADQRQKPQVIAAAQVSAADRKSAIVTVRNRKRATVASEPDLTPEEHKRRGDAADALWREMVRRATADEAICRTAKDA